MSKLKFCVGDLVVVSNEPDATVFRVAGVVGMGVGVTDAGLEAAGQAVQWQDRSIFKGLSAAQRRAFMANQDGGAAHSAGPWYLSVVTFDRKAGHAIQGTCPVIKMPACEAIVASVGASQEEVNANARLIAAAPELLNELRSLLGFIDYHDLAKGNKRLEIKLLDARAVIARAVQS